MKICVFSDSHRRRQEMVSALAKVPDVDAIIHIGDETADASWLRDQVSVPVLGVAGNWDAPTDKYPLERIVRQFGPTIYVTHGHKHRVKSGRSELTKRALAHGANIALYGHTHVADITVVDQCLVLNPGSMAEPRGRQAPSFAMLNIAGIDGGYFVSSTLHGTDGSEIANMRIDVQFIDGQLCRLGMQRVTE